MRWMTIESSLDSRYCCFVDRRRSPVHLSRQGLPAFDSNDEYDNSNDGDDDNNDNKNGNDDVKWRLWNKSSQITCEKERHVGQQLFL